MQVVDPRAGLLTINTGRLSRQNRWCKMDVNRTGNILEEILSRVHLDLQLVTPGKPTWQTAESLVARLMCDNGVFKISQRVNKRKMDVKEERQDRLSTHARKELAKVYKQGLSTEIYRGILKLGYPSRLGRATARDIKLDMTSNRKYFLSAVDFLASLSMKKNRNSIAASDCDNDTKSDCQEKSPSSVPPSSLPTSGEPRQRRRRRTQTPPSARARRASSSGATLTKGASDNNSGRRTKTSSVAAAWTDPSSSSADLPPASEKRGEGDSRRRQQQQRQAAASKSRDNLESMEEEEERKGGLNSARRRRAPKTSNAAPGTTKGATATSSKVVSSASTRGALLRREAVEMGKGTRNAKMRSLEMEVERLKAELATSRAERMQLLEECRSERWEEHRVMLLKAKNQQLEDHIRSLLEAQDQRIGHVRDLGACARVLLRLLDSIPGTGKLEGARAAFSALIDEGERLESMSYSASTYRLSLPSSYLRSYGEREITARALCFGSEGETSSSSVQGALPPPYLDASKIRDLEATLSKLVPGLDSLYERLLTNPLLLSSNLGVARSGTGIDEDGKGGDMVIHSELLDLARLSVLVPSSSGSSSSSIYNHHNRNVYRGIAVPPNHSDRKKSKRHSSGASGERGEEEEKEERSQSLPTPISCSSSSSMLLSSSRLLQTLSELSDKQTRIRANAGTKSAQKKVFSRLRKQAVAELMEAVEVARLEARDKDAYRCNGNPAGFSISRKGFPTPEKKKKKHRKWLDEEEKRKREEEATENLKELIESLESLEDDLRRALTDFESIIAQYPPPPIHHRDPGREVGGGDQKHAEEQQGAPQTEVDEVLMRVAKQLQSGIYCEGHKAPIAKRKLESFAQLSSAKVSITTRSSTLQLSSSGAALGLFHRAHNLRLIFLITVSNVPKLLTLFPIVGEHAHGTRSGRAHPLNQDAPQAIAPEAWTCSFEFQKEGYDKRGKVVERGQRGEVGGERWGETPLRNREEGEDWSVHPCLCSRPPIGAASPTNFGPVDDEGEEDHWPDLARLWLRRRSLGRVGESSFTLCQDRQPAVSSKRPGSCRLSREAR
eukprot:jgi/Bigna1/86281/estExt_fgenesh1_pg.C_90189